MSGLSRFSAVTPANAEPMRSRHQLGLTLIEILLFIVIVGIVAAGLLTAFNGALRNSSTPGQMLTAQLLAQERMEVIIGQRRVLGFGGFTSSTFDPCTATPSSNQPFCTSFPSGYSVTATFSNNWGGDTNYKLITVDVSGPVQTTMQAIVANY